MRGAFQGISGKGMRNVLRFVPWSNLQGGLGRNGLGGHHGIR